MWMVSGLSAIITAFINIVSLVRDKETKYYRFVSFSLTALTLCAFYDDAARRVTVEDWGGLMDILLIMSIALWVCVIMLILINGITLFKSKSRLKTRKGNR